MNEPLLRTPLHDEHVALGAKIVPFAGYEMPVQYPSGITAEHRGVREAAGLFDVSHMGEFMVRGPQALDLVQRVTVNDASKMAVGQAQYSAMCLDSGGVVDDLIVYRFADHWMLVVNASNLAKDLAWIRAHTDGLDVEVENASQDLALLALQGPKARDIVRPLAKPDIDSVKYYRFVEGRVGGIPAIIAGTGYTGEDGFEVCVGAGDAVALWRKLMEAGKAHGLVPTGLGARDSLRLEMGYALYGNDLDEEHTPLESGLGWITKLDKGDFIGRDVLVRQKEQGIPRRLVGMTLKDKGFPRHGYPVVSSGEPVGVLTSGTVSPSLGVGIAMGYVPPDLSKPDTALQIDVRGKTLQAVVQRPPFYTEGSIRR
jgi:glycine cleavage system T protein (aminomethyltransferase)